jgi:hypothetical protein
MTMREQIARKLCEGYDKQARARGLMPGMPLTAYNAGVDMTIDFWNGMADLAVEALREPTKTMLVKGNAASLSTDVLLDEAAFSCVRAMWIAMLDDVKEGG